MVVREQRNIVMCIVLSIITCGIYAYYWMYQLAQDMYNEQTTGVPGGVSTTPGMTVLLGIITCNIFALYAYYQWGEQISAIYAKYGRQQENRGVMYLLLGLLTGGIVPMALLQNDLNNLSEPPPQYGQNAYNQAPGGQQQPPPAPPYYGG